MWYQRTAARLTAWSRRRFLGAALKLPALPIVTRALSGHALADTRAGALPAHARATLERFCYLLYPFPAIGTAPYADVVDALIAAGPDDATLAILAGGIADLDSPHDGLWLELDETRQLEVMKELETSAFFQRVVDTTKNRLFNDPRLWQHIGYEGSSLEFGGYADRGLDDIDWLEGE